jgi:hypothetical protein
MGMPSPTAEVVPHSFTGNFDDEFDYASELEQEIFDEDSETIRGWEKSSGQYKGLYTNKFVKDGMVVHAVNASQYESVGYLSPAYFSEDKEHLSAFAKDMGFSNQIKENQPLMQWL